MALTFAGSCGKTYDGAFGDTVAITTTRTIAVGEQPIISVMCHSTFGANPISTISDPGGNTWVRLLSTLPNSSHDYWYCAGVTTQITSGSTITVTLTTAAGAYRMAFCDSFTGLATSSVLDKSASSDNFAAAVDSTNTATTTQADELVFGGAEWDPSGTPLTAVSLTISQQLSGADRASGTQYTIVSATGSYKVDGTLAGVTDSGATCLTLKATAAPPPILSVAWIRA